MKGLVIKDMMCLRKQRVIFCYVVFCTVVLSVMFVLSAKFGNIAQAGQKMMVENGIGIAFFPQLSLEDIRYDVEIRDLDQTAYRKIGIAVRDRKTAPLAVRRFLEYLVR